MGQTARKRQGYAEYVAQQRDAAEKLEYIEGELYAMTGGTPDHALVAANLIGLLQRALRGRPCRPYTSDLRVRVPARQAATYPDVTVICGEVEVAQDDPHAATNPVALFEVSSKTTAEYDRVVKFDLYSAIPSLRHYVLVYHRSQRVEVYTRSKPDEPWTVRAHGAGETAALPELQASLPVAEVYEGSGVPEQDPDQHRVDFVKEGLAEYGVSARG